MATFDSKGKLEFTIFPHAYGVLSLIGKMFMCDVWPQA
jgi:hypothetical protein